MLTNKSGHYKPGERACLKMMEALLDKGVVLDEVMFTFIDQDGEHTNHPSAMEFLKSLREKYNIKPTPKPTPRKSTPRGSDTSTEARRSSGQFPRRYRRVSQILLKPPRHTSTDSDSLNSSNEVYQMSIGERTAETRDDETHRHGKHRHKRRGVPNKDTSSTSHSTRTPQRRRRDPNRRERHAARVAGARPQSGRARRPVRRYNREIRNRA